MFLIAVSQLKGSRDTQYDDNTNAIAITTAAWSKSVLVRWVCRTRQTGSNVFEIALRRRRAVRDERQLKCNFGVTYIFLTTGGLTWSCKS